MCFTIPYKIDRIENGQAEIEDGRKIRLGEKMRVRRGDYLQIAGNIAVNRISAREGKKIREMIKNLYQGNET